MNVIETELEGLKVIEPNVFDDQRGYFFESYNRKVFVEQGIDQGFVQDNEAQSIRGVLRGLHYQLPPHAQAKLVRVIRGSVFDVAVDLRPDSKTYGQWKGIQLSSENKRQFLVPRGFAHGYLVLSEEAIFAYKCDGYYAPDYEAGLRYDDPHLNIDWPLPGDEIILSDKDRQLPAFGEHTSFTTS